MSLVWSLPATPVIPFGYADARLAGGYHGNTHAKGLKHQTRHETLDLVFFFFFRHNAYQSSSYH